MNRRVALVTFLASLLATGAIGFVTSRSQSSLTLQPIEFNHRKHVAENQIDCSTCHMFYETETFSGLPDRDVCATCHEEAMGKSAEEAKLVRILRAGQPLQWRRLFQQPSHIFYSHRRHVVKAQIKCEQCHGDIAQSTSPPRKVTTLKMEDCIGCHEQRGVATECTTCHR